MKFLRANSRWVLALLLGVALAGLSGCASTESDNASTRPWNAPKTWESGLPSTLNEGR
jgi:hypothetical protein